MTQRIKHFYSLMESKGKVRIKASIKASKVSKLMEINKLESDELKLKLQEKKNNMGIIGQDMRIKYD